MNVNCLNDIRNSKKQSSSLPSIKHQSSFSEKKFKSKTISGKDVDKMGKANKTVNSAKTKKTMSQTYTNGLKVKK